MSNGCAAFVRALVPPLCGLDYRSRVAFDTATDEACYAAGVLEQAARDQAARAVDLDFGDAVRFDDLHGVGKKGCFHLVFPRCFFSLPRYRQGYGRRSTIQ